VPQAALVLDVPEPVPCLLEEFGVVGVVQALHLHEEDVPEHGVDADEADAVLPPLRVLVPVDTAILGHFQGMYNC